MAVKIGNLRCETAELLLLGPDIKAATIRGSPGRVAKGPLSRLCTNPCSFTQADSVSTSFVIEGALLDYPLPQQAKATQFTVSFKGSQDFDLWLDVELGVGLVEYQEPGRSPGRQQAARKDASSCLSVKQISGSGPQRRNDSCGSSLKELEAHGHGRLLHRGPLGQKLSTKAGGFFSLSLQAFGQLL